MVDNPNKDLVFYNYVLCAISGWYSSYDKAEIKKFACTVFTKPELKIAMNLLGDTEIVQGVRAPKNHQSAETCFDSIFNNLEYLDQAQQLPEFAVKKY